MKQHDVKIGQVWEYIINDDVDSVRIYKIVDFKEGRYIGQKSLLLTLNNGPGGEHETYDRWRLRADYIDNNHSSISKLLNIDWKTLHIKFLINSIICYIRSENISLRRVEAVKLFMAESQEKTFKIILLTKCKTCGKH